MPPYEQPVAKTRRRSTQKLASSQASIARTKPTSSAQLQQLQ
jgi:hypothetical protein